MNQLVVEGLLLIRRFQDELRSNPRLIRLMWLTGYFSALLIVFNLIDASEQLASRAQRMLNDLDRVGSIGTKDVWNDRLKEQKVYQSALLRHCGNANNAGLASADIQTVLQQLLVQYEMINSRLTISEPELAGGRLGRIRGQLTGRIEQGNLLPLLSRLEDPSHFFSIERLAITFNDRGDVIDLLVSSCFQLTEA